MMRSRLIGIIAIAACGWAAMPGAAGANRARSSLPLQSPAGIALDASGNIYVTDNARNDVLKLAPAGKAIGQWGKKGKAPGQFSTPAGIAVDSHGTLYVSDYDNRRVERFSPAAGSCWACGARVLALGTIYMSDPDSRLDKISASGSLLGRWGGKGSKVGKLAQFTGGVAVDGKGHVYIADSGNRRVQLFSSAGGLLAFFGGDSRFPFGSEPSQIAVDLHYSMYVTAGGQIVKLSYGGKVLARWSS
jgi:tripartite motif-containing protein 71